MSLLELVKPSLDSAAGEAAGFAGCDVQVAFHLTAA
jgi:hypothetical protein